MHGRESPHHSQRDAKPPGAVGGLRLRVSASRGGWVVAELFLPDGYGFVQHCAKPNNEPFGDDSNYPSIVILLGWSSINRFECETDSRNLSIWQP
jgi:hypothetical protein